MRDNREAVKDYVHNMELYVVTVTNLLLGLSNQDEWDWGGAQAQMWEGNNVYRVLLDRNLREGDHLADLGHSAMSV